MVLDRVRIELALVWFPCVLEVWLREVKMTFSFLEWCFLGGVLLPFFKHVSSS